MAVGVFACVVLVAAFVSTLSVSAAGKITASPSSATVNEGASQIVQIQLTQPIICPTPPEEEVCKVDVNFSSSDPSRVSISPSSVTYLYNEWAQPRTVTVTTTRDFIHTPNLPVTITMTGAGTSPYYDGAISTFTITLNNLDDPQFSGSPSFTGTRDETIPINDLQVLGSSGGTVNLNLFVPSGSLALSNTTGLTFNGPETGKNLNFSGTRSDINAALITLTFKPDKTKDVILQATIDGLRNSMYDPSNRHLYQFATTGGYPTWSEANAAAQGLSFQGATGYLATITSQNEQNMVSGLGSEGWFGGKDSEVEGEWKWTDGPEVDQVFWDQGEVDGMYSNWSFGSPDNYTGSNPSGENCLQMYDSDAQQSKWNDQNCDAQQFPNYIAEYGDNTDVVSLNYKNVNIHVTEGRDLNNDDIEDADQPKVANFLTNDGKWISLELNYDCDIFPSSGLVPEDNLVVQDSDYNYPNGLIDFSAYCPHSSSSSDVKIFFYDTQAADVHLRKYNPNTLEYMDMSSHLLSLEDQTIDGHNVAVAFYIIGTWNGLDTDPNDGDDNIADPVGLAVATSPASDSASTPSHTDASLAGTGDSVQKYLPLILALIGVSSFAVVILSSKKISK